MLRAAGEEDSKRKGAVGDEGEDRIEDLELIVLALTVCVPSVDELLRFHFIQPIDNDTCWPRRSAAMLPDGVRGCEDERFGLFSQPPMKEGKGEEDSPDSGKTC
jgi:hypothetical protein